MLTEKKKEVKVYLGIYKNKCVASINYKGDVFTLPPYIYDFSDSYNVGLSSIRDTLLFFSSNNTHNIKFIYYGLDFDVNVEYKKLFKKMDDTNIKNENLWKTIMMIKNKNDYEIEIKDKENVLSIVGGLYD